LKADEATGFPPVLNPPEFPSNRLSMPVNNPGGSHDA